MTAHAFNWQRVVHAAVATPLMYMVDDLAAVQRPPLMAPPQLVQPAQPAARQARQRQLSLQVVCSTCPVSHAVRTSSSSCTLTGPWSSQLLPMMQHCTLQNPALAHPGLHCLYNPWQSLHAAVAPSSCQRAVFLPQVRPLRTPSWCLPPRPWTPSSSQSPRRSLRPKPSRRCCSSPTLLLPKSLCFATVQRHTQHEILLDYRHA